MSNKVNVKKLPKSEVEIEAEIEASLLDTARNKAIKKFSETLEIQGFRKGHIPEKVIVDNVGEKRLLEEAAEIAINEAYPKILEELKLEAIGRPEVHILKLAFGNPLLFKIKTAFLPEFELPDYRKIGKEAASAKTEEATASQGEIEDVLFQIRKNKAHSDFHKNNPEEKDHDKHPDFEKEENLPILDDEFAKLAGNFQNLEELKSKVKENIIEDKKNREIEKKRALMMEKLLKETPMELPEILIESEVEKTLAQMKDDVVRVGGKFEDYLAHIKKSEEDLRKDLRADAEKKAKIQLIFNKIADKENLQPNKEILDHEVKKILEYYPGANETNARIYVATQLTNQEVLKLLENDAKLAA